MHLTQPSQRLMHLTQSTELTHIEVQGLGFKVQDLLRCLQSTHSRMRTQGERNVLYGCVSHRTLCLVAGMDRGSWIPNLSHIASSSYTVLLCDVTILQFDLRVLRTVLRQHVARRRGRRIGRSKVTDGEVEKEGQGSREGGREGRIEIEDEMNRERGGRES